MLYINIVFNTLLDIIFLQDFLSLLFLLFSYIYIYYLYKSLLKNKSKIKLLIIFSRLLIILLILPIIKNKIYKFEEIRFKSQDIGVFIDNSLSVNEILNNDSSLNIYKKIDFIKRWGKNSDIYLFWYNLSSNLTNPNKILFNNTKTSYDYLSEVLSDGILDQLILISDGNVNSGLLSNNFYNNQNIKVHSIGMGDIVTYKQDIGIVDLNIEKTDESFSVKTTFSVNINNEEENLIYNIYSSSNQIYSDTLLFLGGKYNFDKHTVLDSKLIDKNLNLEIIPLTYSDYKSYNNNWNINIPNQNKNKLLLITGKLNYNTSFLKKNILSIPNTILEHYIIFDNTFDSSNIQINKFDCIVMDNFPNNKRELNLFTKLFFLKKQILFFEGHNFNPNFLNDMLDIAFPNQFYIENINILKNFKLNNEFDIGAIESNYNLFSKNQAFHDQHLFSNQSIAQFVSPDLSFFLIPNISEISFFMKNKYNSNYIANYLKYFINRGLSNNYLLDLKLKKTNYLIGEELVFKLDNNFSIETSSATVIINDLKNMVIDTINYHSNMSLFLNKKGDFEIYFSFKGTNSEIINSNKELFNVNKDNIEVENIFQNVELLMDMSYKTNGIYSDISGFGSPFLDSLRLDPIKNKYQNIYTPLDIFIKEYIFILVIMFFCVEILLRKKVGLL